MAIGPRCRWRRGGGLSESCPYCGERPNTCYTIVYDKQFDEGSSTTAPSAKKSSSSGCITVLVIIGIIAAIAIPNLLASRRAANEGSAQSSIRAIHSAQVVYQHTTGNGAFAPTLLALNGPSLIDGVLSSGTKSGYNFAVVERAGTGATAVFGAYAFPVLTTGVSMTGTRAFGITEVGILRGDTDLDAIPNTRADINALPVLGN